MFFFSSRRRHTRSFHVTGVQTCALPIFVDADAIKVYYWCNYILQVGQLTCARWCGSRNSIILLSGRSCTGSCRLYILLSFVVPHHTGYKVKMSKFFLYILFCFILAVFALRYLPHGVLIFSNFFLISSIGSPLP